ncbi:MAG: ABC transporter ATP-binding protein [Proteobacteria bacterium]|nr:ABC transporter ATP-binding protein [Pseudomonadota bacterium]
MNTSPLIEFKSISKRFGSLHANEQVSFAIHQHSIHGVIGENGAGKSTIMKILYGLLKPDSGEVLLHGHSICFRNPHEAITKGIGMVHQHFMLVPSLTVWENVILGLEPNRFQIDRNGILEKLTSLQKIYGFSLELTARIEDLSIGEQQQVEILKLLYREANILILDEPTAVLTPQEVTLLFEKLKTLKEQGKTIIVITHKLKEILNYTNTVTVMRGGKVITTQETAGLSEGLLSQLIMGRERSPLPKRKGFSEDSQPVLQLNNLSSSSQSSKPLKNLNLSLYPGQILGIAGIEGQGQQELVEIICQAKPFTGSAFLFGIPLNSSSAYSKRQSGFSLIPPDRQKEGLVLNFSSADNFVLGHQREKRFESRGFLRESKVLSFAQTLMNRFDVRPAEPSLPVKALSGGNQQKLLIARETSSKVNFLLACHPTRGVDIGSIEFIHSHFLKLAEGDASILLVSSDLDELLTITDSIAVLREGMIVFESPTSQISVKELGLWMTGAKT